MKKKNDVEVLIDGRKYTLCGFESPEYIQKIASTLIVNWQNFINRRDMQDWIWICVIPCLRLILPTIITKRRKRQANTAPRLS